MFRTQTDASLEDNQLRIPAFPNRQFTPVFESVNQVGRTMMTPRFIETEWYIRSFWTNKLGDG